jgi:lysozyme
MRIQKVSDACIKQIIKHEGLRLKAYRCPVGIFTIGVGNTFYEDGSRVKEGDVITEERAYQLLRNVLKTFERHVDNMTRDDINQNQFDALVSFCYNVGPANLKSSTLLKKVNANPNDATIAAEFRKWTKAAGKVLNGLVKRREDEQAHYFSKIENNLV